MSARLTLICVAAVLAVDQASKALVETFVERGERVEALPGVAIEHTRNTGIAFGLFGDVPPLVIALTLAALVGVLAVVTRDTRGPVWLPAGLLIGGALGNLIDRVRADAVVDFVDLGGWPTFNLADVAITAGAIALLIVGERSARQLDRERAAPSSDRDRGAG